MKVTQVINNNVVGVSKDGQDMILMGKGLGFKKKVGEEIDEDRVEKVFSLSDPTKMDLFKELLADIPFECVEIAQDILHHAEEVMGSRPSEGLIVSLADHIASAIQRHKEGLDIRNGLYHETKLIYKKEFQVGLWAVEHIKERLGVELLKDEAAFIAIHIVNGISNQEISTIIKTTELTQNIYDILVDHFLIAFDEDSLDFHRFFTHLKFYAQRIFNQTPIQADDDFLYQAVKLKYPDAYACVKKINEYLKREFNHEPNYQENLYLMMHIARLVSATKNKV